VGLGDWLHRVETGRWQTVELLTQTANSGRSTRPIEQQQRRGCLPSPPRLRWPLFWWIAGSDGRRPYQRV